jgi:hypothetical protein
MSDYSTLLKQKLSRQLLYKIRKAASLSTENETVKYGLSSTGLRTKWLLWQGPEANSKLQTRPLVREGATKLQNPQLPKGNFKEKEKLVTRPRWAPDTKTDWSIDWRS